MFNAFSEVSYTYVHSLRSSLLFIGSANSGPLFIIKNGERICPRNTGMSVFARASHVEYRICPALFNEIFYVRFLYWHGKKNHRGAVAILFDISILSVHTCEEL